MILRAVEGPLGEDQDGSPEDVLVAVVARHGSHCPCGARLILGEITWIGVSVSECRRAWLVCILGAVVVAGATRGGLQVEHAGACKINDRQAAAQCSVSVCQETTEVVHQRTRPNSAGTRARGAACNKRRWRQGHCHLHARVLCSAPWFPAAGISLPKFVLVRSVRCM